MVRWTFERNTLYFEDSEIMSGKFDNEFKNFVIC